tara:strand:- start:287 stop:598 length:312 start_codon:yes stop_codon:yes gene_type:complete
LTPNKQQSKNKIKNLSNLLFLFIASNFFLSLQSFSQESYKLNELEMNRSNNFEDDDDLDFPTNPFEIVDMIRRTNSMNDATKPSDAIDEAIKSFDIIKEEKQL